MVSVKTGGRKGSGSYSPLEHGPNSRGRPGSSSLQFTAYLRRETGLTIPFGIAQPKRYGATWTSTRVAIGDHPVGERSVSRARCRFPPAGAGEYGSGRRPEGGLDDDDRSRCDEHRSGHGG